MHIILTVNKTLSIILRYIILFSCIALAACKSKKNSLISDEVKMSNCYDNYEIFRYTFSDSIIVSVWHYTSAEHSTIIYFPNFIIGEYNQDTIGFIIKDTLKYEFKPGMQLKLYRAEYDHESKMNKFTVLTQYYRSERRNKEKYKGIIKLICAVDKVYYCSLVKHMPYEPKRVPERDQ